MAGLQGYFLTFIDVKSALDAEKKLFKIKSINHDKLTVQSMPENYPGQVWFWTNLTQIKMQFMKEKSKKKEAKNA